MRSLKMLLLVGGVFAGSGAALAQPPAPATILNVGVFSR